jgi:formate dehydrogenase subunit delta
MSAAQTEKLIMMANQIARAFAPLGEVRAIPRVTDHIAKFWDPRMRRLISAHAAAGGAGLEPYALAAIETLAKARSG